MKAYIFDRVGNVAELGDIQTFDSKALGNWEALAKAAGDLPARAKCHLLATAVELPTLRLPDDPDVGMAHPSSWPIHYPCILVRTGHFPANRSMVLNSLRNFKAGAA